MYTPEPFHAKDLDGDLLASLLVHPHPDGSEVCDLLAYFWTRMKLKAAQWLNLRAAAIFMTLHFFSVCFAEYNEKAHTPNHFFLYAGEVALAMGVDVPGGRLRSGGTQPSARRRFCRSIA